MYGPRPNERTRIVEDAQNFGLAQLYQLRGRIGRGDVKAYCYLFHPAWLFKKEEQPEDNFADLAAVNLTYHTEKDPTEEAKKRLAALMEFSDLGSGFRLALRDMEIRGAGELMGIKQHGYVNEVGLSYYCDLVAAEVKKLHGELVQQTVRATVNLPLAAYIPPDYLPDEADRLKYYKELMAADPQKTQVLLARLANLCGPVPPEIDHLVQLFALSGQASALGIYHVGWQEGGLELLFTRQFQMPPNFTTELFNRFGMENVRFISSKNGDGVHLSAGKETSALDFTQRALTFFTSLLAPQKWYSISMRNGFIILLSILMAAACQQQPKQLPQAEETATIEITPPSPAKVQRGQVVSSTDINDRLPFLSKQDQQFVQTSLGRQNMLQVIAREKLIALAAQDEGLDKNPDYQALLTQKRLALDTIYQDFAAHTLENLWYETQRKKGALDVTEEEINDYYKKYPYEMRLKQIIVDNAQTADQLLRALKSNRSRWKELSRQYNTAPEALREEIAFMPGEFLPDIEVIAANSATGSVQGFFKTAYGFHIIMKTGEKKLSLPDAAPRIRAILESNKLDKLLENLQNKYEVVIYDQNE